MHISPKWLTASVAFAVIAAGSGQGAAQKAARDSTSNLQVAADGNVVPVTKDQDRVPQTVQMVFEGRGAATATATPTPCATRSALTADAAEALVRRIAETENFYPDFVLAIARRESRFDANALSEAGAFGLMQLMPTTDERFGVDRCDPEDNVRGGIRYLRVLWERLRNPFYILAAYNAGEAAVAEHRGVPPYHETVGFVAAVISDFYGYPPLNAPGGSTPAPGAIAAAVTAPAAAASPRRASPVRHASANPTSTRSSRPARSPQSRQDWLVLHVE